MFHVLNINLHILLQMNFIVMVLNFIKHTLQRIFCTLWLVLKYFIYREKENIRDSCRFRGWFSTQLNMNLSLYLLKSRFGNEVLFTRLRDIYLKKLF